VQSDSMTAKVFYIINMRLMLDYSVFVSGVLVH